MKMRKAFLWMMIVSLTCAAGLGIIAIILPNIIPSEEEILTTALLLGLYSLPALACSIVLGKGRLKPIMWLGIVGSLLAWVLWMPIVWMNPWQWTSQFDVEEVIFKTGFTLTFISIWALHLGLMNLLTLDRAWFGHARVATLGVVGLLTLVGIIALWFEYDDDWFLRAVGVLGILSGCGTLVTPIFALLDHLKRRTSRESIPTSITMKISCPRCHTTQQMNLGRSRCSQCGLRIELHVEEPRCACGYLLYELTSNQCPECGRVVPEADRWAIQENATSPMQ